MKNTEEVIAEFMKLPLQVMNRYVDLSYPFDLTREGWA